MDDLEVDNLDFCYTRLERRNPEYGVDYADIRILNADAHIKDFSVVKGAVRGDIISFSADERSGFRVDQLSGVMYVDRGVIHVDDVRIETPTSTLNMPRMHINGESWLQYKNYIDEVQMDMVAVNSTVTTSDIGYFAPALRNWGITLQDMDVTYAGTVDDFEATVRDVDFGKSSTLDATAHITGMPKWDSANYIVGVERMHLTAEDANAILDSVVKNPLPEKVIDIIERVEWVDMRATFGGRWDSFRVAGNVNSATGHLRADVNLNNTIYGI